MANVMMFGFLFLVAVVTQVRASNNTTTVSTTLNSTSPTVNVTSLPPTTAGNRTSTTSGSKPTNATVPGTKPTNVTVSGTTAQTTSNGSKTPSKSATKTNPRSKPTTTQRCSVPSRHRNKTDFKPSDVQIKIDGKDYPITGKSCSGKSECCAGLANTNMTLTLKDCGETTVEEIVCEDITEPCKCRAGLLSASFLISLLGMLLYFVF